MHIILGLLSKMAFSNVDETIFYKSSKSREENSVIEPTQECVHNTLQKNNFFIRPYVVS